MTSVLIADDHPMIRSAVSMLLQGTEFETVGQAVDAEGALAAIERHGPDIVILDLAMPGGSGLDVLRRTRAGGGERPIVLLTAEIDDSRLADALDLGINGVVLKNSDPAYLLDCLLCVRDGGRWIDPDLRERAAIVADRATSQALSSRERELVELVAQGLRNREIASELGITEGTVKVYLHSIFEKLGVASRTELAMRFRG